MREFLKRSITGLLYVLILLSAIFLSHEAFTFLFLIFGITCLYEFKKLIKLRGYYIFIAFLGLWWVFSYLLQNETETIAFHYTLLILCLTVNIFLARELFIPPGNTYHYFLKFIVSLFYISGGCIFLTLLPYYSGTFSKSLITGIFILSWTNDSFAYLTGKWLGKRKLCERISPRKTIEGSIGGILFSLLSAYFVAQYDEVLTLFQWMALALVASVAGILGDLVESKFKRMAGVKDSGAILPGHGGLLDRLDSLLYAAPFLYSTLQLINYVS